MARSKTSQRWLKEHFNDIYVQKAQQEGYRSRAVYKLKEIQEKDRLIRPGMTVVELGAAPGGWSQYVAECLRGQGRMIALDILPMDALPDVTFIQGDFREDAVLDALYAELGDSAVDLVISDIPAVFAWSIRRRVCIWSNWLLTSPNTAWHKVEVS